MKNKQNLPFRGKKIIAYLVITIIFIILARNIFINWQEIKLSIKNFTVEEIVLVIVVITSLHFLNSLSWHLLTKAMSFNITFKENIRIWLLPNISRYIPGIVWQYMGRIFLLSKYNVSKGQATLSVALDALFTFSIGAFVVLLTILVFKAPFGQNSQLILFLAVLLPVIATFTLSNKTLLTWILNIAQKIKGKKYSLNVPNFDKKWLLVLSFVTFSQFILAGFSLFIISNALFSVNPNLIPVFGGIYAGSWILGYISFFAPGGLGVQELSIAGLLSLFIPFPIASLTAIMFRFVLTLAEFVLVLLVFRTTKGRKSVFF